MNNKPTATTRRLTQIHHHTQGGAVLVVALLLLLVMTILGVSGVSNSLLEERMSGNFHESYSAMQSTETALRIAENWLTNEVTAETVQFVPSTDTSYSAAQDWFGVGSLQQGLYSTQAAPGISTPCQGQASCTFIATDEDHWCLPGGCPELPRGYMELGIGVLPAIDADMVYRQPRFIVEYLGRGLGPSPGILIGESSTAAADLRMHAFRITAIGWGREETTRYVLQSHFQLQL